MGVSPVRVFDINSFYRQITVDHENKRLVWKPSKLEDNIFELLGLAKQILNIKIVGMAYSIGEGKYAVKYEGESW